MKLIPLSEHNALIEASVHDPMGNEPRPNGIACPSCGKELVDTSPNMILTSHPPLKNVFCRKCGWSGTRLC